MQFFKKFQMKFFQQLLPFRNRKIVRLKGLGTYFFKMEKICVLPQYTLISATIEEGQFFRNFIWDDFQLSFSAENEMENHHFPKSKNWKKMQNFDFCKKLPRIILVMFQRKPFGLGIFETCFFTLLASEHIFLPQGGIFLQKCPRQAKFSSKMAFSEILTKRPRGKKSWNLKFV